MSYLKQIIYGGIIVTSSLFSETIYADYISPTYYSSPTCNTCSYYSSDSGVTVYSDSYYYNYLRGNPYSPYYNPYYSNLHGRAYYYGNDGY